MLSLNPVFYLQRLHLLFENDTPRAREKQTILKLRIKEKLIKATGETLGVANKTIWNVLKKESQWCTNNQTSKRLAKENDSIY